MILHEAGEEDHKQQRPGKQERVSKDGVLCVWIVCVWCVFGVCLVCVWSVSGVCLMCVRCVSDVCLMCV